MNQFMLSLVTILLLASCSLKPRTSEQQIVRQNLMAQTPIDSVAIKKDMVTACLKFMNEYLTYRDSVRPNEMEFTWWIVANPMLTEDFKVEYRQLVESYRAHDPELGLDWDPILEAQDSPIAFELNTIHANGYLTINGTDWKEFKVIVRVAQIDGRWLIHGSGRINIPEEKRIPN